MEFQFPDLDLEGIRPFGHRILVQLRYPKSVSDGGIIYSDESKENEKWNVQTGRIVAIGDGAFKNRTTLEPWPEGQWAKVGDYVRVPKWGIDRIEVKHPSDNGTIVLIICDDTQIFMGCTPKWAREIRAVLG